LNLFSFVKELIREINTYGFSLFDLKKELEQNIENNLLLIMELDKTIIEMKKELVERGIQNDFLLRELKKDKLEKQTREMFRKW
jgi:regulator of replication initiation timing|tara:strand:- start:329 stop:580 length:252 start_codon:yes stop_codon:yes gene_type:complete